MTTTSSARLAGRTALVTGASRGIGLGIAHRLVAEGARVVITARQARRRSTPPSRSSAARTTPSRWRAGPTSPTHRAAAFAAAAAAFGPVDLLVNNAGINPAFGPLIDLDLDAARKILEVNAIATLAWTQQACATGLRERGGAIVNVASVAGLRPAPGIGLYGASKAFVIHLTEELAVELGPSVRVNAVAPAVVKTRFAAALYEGREEEVSAAYPMRRLGVPEDIAGAVAFLLSDDAAWVTGQTLVVDGGLLLSGGV